MGGGEAGRSRRREIRVTQSDETRAQPPARIARQPEILIRECRGFDEYDACVRLQVEIWGYEVSDTIPLREFIVIQRIGGQVIGAFDVAKSQDPAGSSGGMVGFAMSMPGILDRKPYLHSHMLAVQPGYRDSGIGRRLKLAQRNEALLRGIQKMEWTFDPLEIKNAYLNIVRLGAIIHSYTPNFYGVFSSRLQAGLPTDRLHAEWWMDSPRVRAALSGGSMLLPDIQETIVVPGEIRKWKQDPSMFDRAAALQSQIRERFIDAFSRGLAVVGFARHPGDSAGNKDTSSGVYQLASWDEA
jgi:predicted GNAT superfamily acetyltransferase